MPDFEAFEVLGHHDYVATLNQAHAAAERKTMLWGAGQQSVHSLTLEVSASSGAMAEAANEFEATSDPRDATELLVRAIDNAGIALAVATRIRKVLVTGGPA